jgi:iron-sulfur cluster repair protein YtfE (RIC family)
MNAIEFLKTDHAEFRKLLAQLAETGDQAVKSREAIFNVLKAELIAHEIAEEEVLYPALAEYEQAEEIVRHSYEEHHVADVLIDELTVLAFDDPAWGAKAHVLKESLEHHIEDEEEEMFPKARKFLADELDEIGDELEGRKDEILGSSAAAPAAKAQEPRA